MKSVVLRLEGPLQSWGTQGRFSVRVTDREPSKSGVLGLIGAALGMERGDSDMLQRLRQLRMAVRVDREGSVLRDYHTVGGGRVGSQSGMWSIKDGRKEPGLTAITQRYYLADASFVVALGSNDPELVDEIAGALQTPRWPLFLGRRACVPSTPVLLCVLESSPEQALRLVPFEPRDEEPVPDRLRVVLETTAEDGRPRDDDPLDFALYRRRHGLRHVRVEFIRTDGLGSP